MAIAVVALTSTPAPRSGSGPDVRVPPRIYSPFPSRRLVRPMAVRADAETASAAPGRTRWSVFRARRDTDRTA